MRVLIADESSLVRERLSAALYEIEGVAIVGQTPDAQRAVDAVRRLSPDVVIMDMVLRGAAGIETLRTMKQCDPAPIVLVFTSYTSAEYKDKWVEAGADFVFAKSTEFKSMFETLKTLVKGHRQISRNS